MGNDSQLIPEFNSVADDYMYSDPVLLSESTLSRLYRVSRDGKYFIIKTANDNTGRSNALIKREYEISIGIDCPYIVNVFTYEEDTIVGPGIIMGYVDGRTLDDFLKENPSAQLRKRVFEQLIEAVAYLHLKGIIHNDLKPENILVTSSYNSVKLIDFGLSDDDAHYLSKTLGCTPRYASPELMEQSKGLDARSDIYSLGLLMKDIFGKKYGYISSKATRNDRTKRYANVEQIQKAIKRRSTFPIILSLFLLFCAALMPYFLIPESGVRQKIELETLSSEMIEELKALTDSCLLTMDEVRFYEFAIIETNDLMNKYWNIRDTILQKTDDKELQAALGSIYGVESGKYSQQLIDKVETMPKISESGLSNDELMFYIRLLQEKKPYQPYKE